MAAYSFSDVYKGDITRNWEVIRSIRKPIIAAAVSGFAIGRWLRAGHDVRLHHCRRQRQIRSA